jgi:hypothetical protein
MRGRARSLPSSPKANVGRERANSVGAPMAGRAPLAGGPAPPIAPPPLIGARSDVNRVVVGTYLTHHGQDVNPAGRVGRPRAMSVRRLTDAELVDAANPLHSKGNSLTPPERQMAASETVFRASALAIGADIHTPPGGAHISVGPHHAPHMHGSSAVQAPDAAMIRMGRFGQSFVDAAFRGDPVGGAPAVVPSAVKQMGVARRAAPGAATYGVGVSGVPNYLGDVQTVNTRLATSLATDSAPEGYPGAPAMQVLRATDPSPGVSEVRSVLGRLLIPGIPDTAYDPGVGGAPAQLFVRGRRPKPAVLAVIGVPGRSPCAALTASFAANVPAVPGVARIDPRAAAIAATPATPELGTQAEMLYEAILNPTGAPPVAGGVPAAGLPPPMVQAPGMPPPPVVVNSGLPAEADRFTTIARSHPATVVAATAEAAAAAPAPGTRPRSQSLSALTESCRNCLTGVGR